MKDGSLQCRSPSASTVHDVCVCANALVDCFMLSEAQIQKTGSARKAVTRRTCGSISPMVTLAVVHLANACADIR